MAEWQLRTPVAFFIYNRPDTTEVVFEQIARAKPPKLLVVCDGPNPNRPEHREKVAQSRAIIDRVDWPCDVITNYSTVNLGCRARVASGLDWVFEQAPEAIILEDDCVPHPTFFRFCEELLERYRDDERVGMISGDNFQAGRRAANGSYYFSKYTHIWGWASWRRAWRHYDVNAKLWPEFLASGMLNQMTLPCERETWRTVFDGVHQGKLDTWDYQWTLACWAHSMLGILPEVNLISNIGFGPQATHTRADSPFANLSTQAVQWPLREPTIVAAHPEADKRTAERMFAGTFAQSVKRKIRRVLTRQFAVAR